VEDTEKKLLEEMHGVQQEQNRRASVVRTLGDLDHLVGDLAPRVRCRSPEETAHEPQEAEDAPRCLSERDYRTCPENYCMVFRRDGVWEPFVDGALAGVKEQIVRIVQKHCVMPDATEANLVAELTRILPPRESE
jgi:hypothetical protein